MKSSTILARKELGKMLFSQTIDFTMKIQGNMIFGQYKLYNENKRINEKLTDIQKKMIY